MTEPVKKYESSSMHPAYLRGKYAIIQEGIDLASYMLENGINSFYAQPSATGDSITDDFVGDYLYDDAYLSDIDIDEDNI